MKVYTFEEVSEWVAAVVREKGEDFVHQPRGLSCKYLREEGGEYFPDCLMGYILMRYTPITTEELLWHEGSAIDDLRHSDFGFTEKARDWMNLVQQEQDSKQPWGSCVTTANRCIKIHEYDRNEDSIPWDILCGGCEDGH